MFLVIIASCEEVVQIDPPAEEPRLIVDALIPVDLNEPVINVVVKVSLTSSFFGTTPVADLNHINIINVDQPSGSFADNVIFLMENVPGTGIYSNVASQTLLTDGELWLQFNHEDQLYIAQTRFVPTAPIDTVMQGEGVLFDDDETEIVVSFTDLSEENDNYYLFSFGDGEYFGTKDTFYQGQSFQFSYFSDQVLTPGQEVEIAILGADVNFFNYMQLLIDQTDDEINVFDTPVATVRGNIFNVTELDNIDVFDNVDQPDNFPLGYFAVVQSSSKTLIIE